MDHDEEVGQNENNADDGGEKENIVTSWDTVKNHSLATPPQSRPSSPLQLNNYSFVSKDFQMSCMMEDISFSPEYDVKPSAKLISWKPHDLMERILKQGLPRDRQLREHLQLFLTPSTFNIQGRGKKNNWKKAVRLTTIS